VAKFTEMKKQFGSQARKSSNLSEIKIRLKDRLELDDEFISENQGDEADDPKYIELCDPDINDKYNFKNKGSAGISLTYFPPTYQRDKSGKKRLNQNGCGEIAIQIDKEKLHSDNSETIYEIIENEDNNGWDGNYKWMKWYEFETDLRTSEIVDKICEKYREMTHMFLSHE
jgi:hypothetical protein